jgi:hypothetical protein
VATYDGIIPLFGVRGFNRGDYNSHVLLMTYPGQQQPVGQGIHRHGFIWTWI